MSLTACLTKAKDHVTAETKTRLLELAKGYRAAGMSNRQAERAAVGALRDELKAREEKVAAKVTKLRQGGDRDAVFSASRKLARVNPFEMSTRAPWAKANSKFTPEDSVANLLIADFADGHGQEDWVQSVTNLVEHYPNYREADSATTPAKKLERLVRHMVDNLLWLHDQVPEATRNRSKLWYDGANAIANRWAKRYDLSESQVAGILAVLSPQKDWFMNVSLANRVIDIMNDRQAFQWSPQMESTAARIFGKATYQEDIDAIRGQTLQDLDDDYLRAMWIRIYDEAHNPRSFMIVSPEGDFVAEARAKTGKLAKVAWGGVSTIAKAVAIAQKGDLETISKALGRKHKVRNFYNNILVPNSPNGHVTIDTHAVAAALLRALSGNSKEVTHNFSGPANAAAGLSGVYPLYEEAYRRAAEKRGILPRELQSITWEAVRGLFTPSFKQNADNVALIDHVWQQFQKGRLSHDNAREEVRKLAGGIDEPAWAGRRDAGTYEEDESAADEGDVAGDGVSGRRSRSAAGGARGANPGRAQVEKLQSARDKAERRTRELQEGDLSDEVKRSTARVLKEDLEPGLEGLPRYIEIPGYGVVVAGRLQMAEDAARDYMAKAGLEYAPPAKYVKVDKARARRIAQAYDEMKHDPQNPDVQAAYQALADEVTEQYRAVMKSGLTVEFIDTSKSDPYARSPRLVTEDVRLNNHMWVFSTRDGFGSDASFDPADNPMLAATEFLISGKVALVNDLFRVVHDYFGHVKEGLGFRADGEENAWRAHSSMFSPLARKAMTSETRGQNSWVNYGPAGDKNRSASSADTVYADQKTGLLPDWVVEEGASDAQQSKARDVTQTPEFKKWFDGSQIVDHEGKPMVAYHGTASDFSRFDFKRGGDVWGTSDSKNVMWFSTFVDRANAAARDAANVHAEDDDSYEAQTGANVMPVYLRVTNPRVFTMKETLGSSAAFAQKIKAARADGHDGIIMPGEMGGQDIAVFNPEQIKSASANDGSFDGDDSDITSSSARWTNERIERAIGEFSYFDGRTKAMAAFVEPSEFVEATSGSERMAAEVRKEAGALDEKKLSEQLQTPFLYVDTANGWEIVGHEGRHRMAALAKAGISRVPVVLVMYKNGYRAPAKYEAIDSHELLGQTHHGVGTGLDIDAYELEPLTYENAKKIKQIFGGDADIKFSTSRRDLPFKEVTKRTPELAEAAEQVKAGKMSAAEYDRLVNLHKPVEAYDEVPQPETDDRMSDALTVNQRELLNAPIENGSTVGLRLDIPAYTKKGVWVVSIHEGKKDGSGGMAKSPISYRSTAVIDNPKLSMKGETALAIATGTAKAPFATIGGRWSEATPKKAEAMAKAALKDKSWVQVGMDPERHSYFYDRASTQPVVSGEKAIQVGGLVLVKNPVYAEKSEFLFSPARSMFSPGFNPELKRGEVREPTEEEKRLVQERDEAQKDASGLWGMGKIKAVNAIAESLKDRFEKAGITDQKMIRDIANSMFFQSNQAGDEYSTAKGEMFADYREAEAKVTELRGRLMDMIAQRIGPPEFEGMRQLADFDRPVTHTPAFERWFAGSKVVDKHGRPLIAFHGTNQDFSEFRTVMEPKENQLSNNNWFGQLGSWFAAPSPDSNEYEVGSAEYTAEAFSELRSGEGEIAPGSVVYPVFLSIKNPYETEGYEDLAEQRDEAGGGKQFREMLEAEGYDGVVVRESSTDGGQYRDDWVAFHSSQIKSAIGNDGSFDADDSDITSSNARPAFYSQLQRAIEQVPERLATMAAPQWKLWLDANAAKSGVKKEEIEWSGIKDYLDTRGKEKVSSQELSKYLADNGVQVKDVVLGDSKLTAEQRRRKAELEAMGEAIDGDNALFNELMDLSMMADGMNGEPRGDVTKFGQYTVPGGENYREVLITLPKKEDFSIDDFFDRMEKKYGRGFIYDTDGNYSKLKEDVIERLYADDQEEYHRLAAKKQPDFTAPAHWGDIPNVVAHIRVDDRTDADGKKVLFINEIQSDWAQRGRRVGIRGRDTDAKIKALEAQISDVEKELEDVQSRAYTDENLRREEDLKLRQLTLADEWNSLRNAQAEGVPEAPFIADTKSWVSLALKRAIMMAVRGGYDKVAFVTGDQAADFFDLSKQVDQIRYVKKGDDRWDVWASDQYGSSLNDTVDKQDLTAKEIEDFVGKDVAQKIVDGDGREEDGDMVLEGLDLKIGGEGMHAFYDKIVPQVANDVLKKIGGGKVGDVVIQNNDGGDRVIELESSGLGNTFYIMDHETGEYWDHASDRWSQHTPELPYSRSIAEKYISALEGTPKATDKQKQPGFDITDAMRDTLDDGVALFSNARDVVKDYIVVHAGSMFDKPDPKFLGKGEGRGSSMQMRPLGNGLYGYLARAPEEIKQAVRDARHYLKYSPTKERGIHAFKVEMRPGDVLFGSVWDEDLLTDDAKASRKEFAAADAIPPGPERKAAYAELDKKYPRKSWAESRAEDASYPIKTESLPIGLIEIAVRDLGRLDRLGSWSEDTPDSEIVDGINGELSNLRRSAARSIGTMDVGFGYKVSDWLDSSKKVSWWDKSVGTPYHLAQKFPSFKRAYDAIQNFIADVSKYATHAHDMAPSILPKLEKMGDIRKTPLSAADVEALHDPVFQGTLVYTRDANGDPVEAEDVGTAGIVWTDDELSSMWHLDERQRGIYREFRKATNKSIADLAITGMVRLAGQDGEGVRGRVLAATNIQAAADILADHLAFLAASDPRRANTLMNTARIIKQQADEARGLMAKGYAPLSRYGDFTVYAPTIGEHGYFEMFENERDANKRARELRAEHPGQAVDVGTMSKEAYKLFKGVTPETLALFGDALGLDESAGERESQVFQEYLKLAKSTRSAMKRLIKRKGVAGFSQDVGRVLAGFVYSNARQSATNLNAGEMLRSVNEIKEGDLKDHAVRLLEYAQNPQEEAQAIRGLMFTQYIGGNVASAMVNLTQSLTTTFPTLSMHFGIGKAGKAMVDALGVVKSRGAGDADMEAALKRAEEEGVTAPQETHQLMAQAQGRGSLKSGDGTAMGNGLAKLTNGFSKAMFVWGKMFGWAELKNREIAFAAAYQLAREKGETNPYEFAKKIVADTQFTMNKGNNPVFARGPVGATLFTFKKFMINYLEGLARMWGNGPEGKKAFALSLAIMFLLAGFGGFPFADDLDDVIDGFMQRVLNKSFSSKQAKKEFFASMLGDAGADFVMGGISSIPGFPVDFSGRLGLGNIAPGTGFFTKKQDYSRDAAEIGGAVGDFAKRALTAAGSAAQGDFAAAAEGVVPMAIANAMKAKSMAELGYYQDLKGRKVIDTTLTEAALKAIGFQPQSVKKVQEATVTQASLIAQNKIRETEIADLWAKGRIEKKPELIEDAKRQLREWNESNPTSPLKIDNGQIDKRVKAANMSKAQRVAKTAPKEIRASVAADLKRDLAE